MNIFAIMNTEHSPRTNKEKYEQDQKNPQSPKKNEGFDDEAR